MKAPSQAEALKALPGEIVAEGDTQAASAHDLKPITKKELEKYLKLLEMMEAEFGEELGKQSLLLAGARNKERARS